MRQCGYQNTVAARQVQAWHVEPSAGHARSAAPAPGVLKVVQPVPGDQGVLVSSCGSAPHMWTDSLLDFVAQGDTDRQVDIPWDLSPRERYGVDNFSMAVLEVQIKLYCYRKVVLKRYVDHVITRLRWRFPRQLRDSMIKALSHAVLNGDAAAGTTASGSKDPRAGGLSADDGVLRLMTEHESQRRARARLVAQVEALRESQGILARAVA